MVLTRANGLIRSPLEVGLGKVLLAMVLLGRVVSPNLFVIRRVRSLYLLLVVLISKIPFIPMVLKLVE